MSSGWAMEKKVRDEWRRGEKERLAGGVGHGVLSPSSLAEMVERERDQEGGGVR